MKKFPHRILVEGCDGSGKSTLVRFIEEKLNGNTFTSHWTAPPKEMTLEEKNRYMDVIHHIGLELSYKLKNHIIFDRFHTSDLVYLPLYSGGVNNYTWTVDKMMYEAGFKQVYVYADARTIRDRLSERGDWFIDVEDVEKILHRYERVIELQEVPTFFYNTGPMHAGAKALQDQRLLEFLQIEEEQ